MFGGRFTWPPTTLLTHDYFPAQVRDFEYKRAPATRPKRKHLGLCLESPQKGRIPLAAGDGFSISASLLLYCPVPIFAKMQRLIRGPVQSSELLACI